MNKELSLTETEKDVLKNLQQEISQKLAGEVLQVELFGSKARGESHPDSDIDILMVVRNKKRAEEVISDFVLETLLQGGPYLSIKIYQEAQYQRLNHPATFFMRHLHRDAVRLWPIKAQ